MRPPSCSLVRLVTVGWLLINASVVLAHDPGLSTATVRLGNDKILASLAFSFADANQLLAQKPDGATSASATALEKLAPEALEIMLDGKATAPSSVHCHFDEVKD